jgi:hypothetical protein
MRVTATHQKSSIAPRRSSLLAVALALVGAILLSGCAKPFITKHALPTFQKEYSCGYQAMVVKASAVDGMYGASRYRGIIEGCGHMAVYTCIDQVPVTCERELP